jgi:RES domain-containing protein
VVISIPANVRIERRGRNDLPRGWDSEDCQVSRTFGDAWLQSARSAVLLVPSVVAELETNLLVNPAHPHFKMIRASEPKAVQWDARLFRNRPTRD